MNKLLLYSLFFFSLAQAADFTQKEKFFIPHKIGMPQLLKLEERKNNEYYNIHDYRLNPILHKPHYGTAKNATAGFWLSKFIVHALAQIAYTLVAGATALVYPPAAPVVYCSLQLTFAALVEIASNIVASGTILVAESAIGSV